MFVNFVKTQCTKVTVICNLYKFIVIVQVLISCHDLRLTLVHYLFVKNYGPSINLEPYEMQVEKSNVNKVPHGMKDAFVNMSYHLN